MRAGRATTLLLAVAGIAVAVALGLAANEISGDSIGLSAKLEPGQELAPSTAESQGQRRQRQRRRAAQRTTTTPATTPAAGGTVEDRGSEETEGDSSGQGRGRGRGRSDDDSSGPGSGSDD